MSSFLTYFSSVIGDGLIGATGGSIVLLILFGLLGFAFILWKLQVSMPVALLLSFFSLAVLSREFDSNIDPVFGLMNSSFSLMLFLIVVAVSGLLIWHLFMKKSQAG